jgi:hypothetical protein
VRRAGIAAAVALTVLAAGCGSDESKPAAGDRLPKGAERVKLDPASFSTQIDNPYWPMAPGSRWVYRETDEKGKEQRVEVTVTNRTKKVAAGVTARVVRDVVTQDGELVEDTFDWYAQDRQGNVWYMGEDTKEYESGKVSTTAGSWEAGKDGAQAGVIMPADPKPGLEYRQEHYEGEAEDAARVLSVDEQAEVPAGHYTRAVLTKDINPLEPQILEHKLYAKGVGPVLVLNVSGGGGREELLRFEKG